MKTEKFWQSLKDVFFDFSQHSSIHGVLYIGERQRSWFEKLLWIVGFCISIFCCGNLILDAWRIDPIIINFAGKLTPIWQIPFPAVTICPKILAQASFFNITDLEDAANETLFTQISDNEKQKIFALGMLCSHVLIDSFDENDTCNGYLDILREIRIPPEDFFVECKFQNQVLNCTSAFKELVTGFALCYRFNGLEYHRTDDDNHNEITTENWNVDAGYKTTAPMETYPHRAIGASKRLELSIILKMNWRDFRFSCRTEPGFWIELQTPGESPQFEFNYYNPTLTDSLTFVLKPNILRTSNELRKYPVTTRKCYFGDERRLKFFKHYSQYHCEINCRIELYLEKCNCLLITLFKNQKGINVCGHNHQNCIQFYNKYLMDFDDSFCNCLPACSSITYEAEVTAAEFDMAAYPEDFRKGFEYSKFTFYFKENQILTVERTEAYGMTDFLANCGGILGLCLGVSVISLLEILYFCTIRLYFYLRTDQSADQTIFVEELQYFRYKRQRAPITIKDLVTDYSSKTTIQGTKYVADSNLSLIERVWWAIVVVISMFCCGSLISDMFDRYNDTPLIITYANEEMPIYEIPFPAVTVCPQTVAREFRRYYDYFKVDNRSLYNFRNNYYKLMTAFSQVCDPELFDHIDPENRTNCEYCSEYLEYMMGNMWTTFYDCYQYPEDRCDEIFELVMTERGVCYTFNGQKVYRTTLDSATSKDNWTLDDGYTANTTNSDDLFPRPGSNDMLIVYLIADNNMNDGLCKGPIKGFNVYLHLPNEAAQITKHYYLVPLEQTVKITVSPKMIKTAPELRDFAIDKRQCFFNDERYLRFFRYYTQNNCEVECLANLTVSICGCQRFYLPKIRGVKFCGIGHIKCYQSLIHQSVQRNAINNISTDCNCLPACTSISFDAEINQIYILTGQDFIPKDDTEYFWGKSISKIVISMRDVQFIPLKRSQLYGKTEFFANCGGLLGLFLGFSLMSILEIFYFCTIRLICNVKGQMV